ncbi:MAG: hypothetical protein AAFS10_05805 [Myxococcota bacterium]
MGVNHEQIWGTLTALLGLNLWLTLCLLPLQIELASPDMNTPVLLAYILPVLLLAAGMLLRRPSFLLSLFPSSFLLIFFVLPKLDRIPYEQFDGWLSLGLSLVSYAVASALWVAAQPPQETTRIGWTMQPLTLHGARDGRHLEAQLKSPSPRWSRVWWPYQHHFVPRNVALVLLLLVPFYGLNFADGVAERYAEAFLTQADQARVMANLLFLFLWIVVAYLFFLSPGLNLELEQREMDEVMARYEEKALRRPVVWVFVAATGGAVILMGALLALRLF